MLCIYSLHTRKNSQTPLKPSEAHKTQQNPCVFSPFLVFLYFQLFMGLCDSIQHKHINNCDMKLQGEEKQIYQSLETVCVVQDHHESKCIEN